MVWNRESGIVVSCLDCNAACCKGKMLMALNEEEKKLLENSGTALELIFAPLGKKELEGFNVPPKMLEEMKKGRYLRLTDCGFLAGNLCGIHDDPRRPGVCKMVVPGSQECLDTRGLFGQLIFTHFREVVKE